MSAGPYPTKTMHERLRAEAHQTVLDPGQPIVYSVRDNFGQEPRTFQYLDLTNGPEDLVVGEIGVSMALTQALFAGVEVRDAQGVPIETILEAAPSEPAVWRYATVPTSLNPYRVLHPPLPFELPGGHTLRLKLRAEGAYPAYLQPNAPGTTPGVSAVLRDAQEQALGQAGHQFVSLQQASRSALGQLPPRGMRRVGTPTTSGVVWVPGAFEIVDDGMGPPYLRYFGRDGEEYRWSGTLHDPGAGGGS